MSDCAGSDEPFVPGTLSRDGEVGECPVCHTNQYVRDSPDDTMVCHETPPEPPSPVAWSDITSALTRNVNNGGYPLSEDIMEVATVQAAARKVIGALDLFGLEVSIVRAERDAASSAKSAEVSRQIADDLRKVRDRVHG